MRIPQANTPRIMAKKKKTCKRIVIYSILLSLIFTAFFIISIKINPPAPFILSLFLFYCPFITIFAAIFFYYHVKLFPQFDYYGFDKKDLSELKISPKYIEERSKSRKRKALWTIILIMAVIAGLCLLIFGRNAPENSFLNGRFMMYAIEFLPALGIVLCTKFLYLEVYRRRELEFFKYILK